MRGLPRYVVHLLGRKSSLKNVYLSALRDRCLVCEERIAKSELYTEWRICPHCRFHYSLTARERIGLLSDEGSFRETRRNLVSLDPLSFSSRTSYRKNLSQDQTRTGLTDAVITGQCTFGGQKVKLIVLDFGFMGGSMGSVVGEKVALAFEAAAKQQRPVVAVITGGGVRAQEGILSLMQMAKTVTAVRRLAKKGLPFIAVLANPATGQAYASFVNLADIIIAEPGSLIGLVPLRRLKDLSETPLPIDAHTAEAHLEHGLLDMVIDREILKERLTSALLLLRGGATTFNKKDAKKIKFDVPDPGAVNKSVEMTRHHMRPSILKYIDYMIDDFVELKGDRVNSDDRVIRGGVGFLEGVPIMIMGQERSQVSHNGVGYILPKGFRKAQRLMKLAAKFKLPMVTLVDTEGAYPSLHAEEEGVGNVIANTISLMVELPVPVVSAIIGEAGSEGALALGIADTILMQQFAIYSPLNSGVIPKGFSQKKGRIKKDLPDLKLTAHDCKKLGIIDHIIPEPIAGAHTEPRDAAETLRRALIKELTTLTRTSNKKLVKNRVKKFRKMGEFSSYFKEAVRREVSALRRVVLKGPRSVVRGTNLSSK